jgi:tetratricopeptide (TPR) repeat protein
MQQCKADLPAAVRPGTTIAVRRSDRRCVRLALLVAAMFAFGGASALAQSRPDEQKPFGTQRPSTDTPGTDKFECLDEPQSTRRAEACTAVIDNPIFDNWTRARAYAMRALSHSLTTDYDAAIRDYDEAIRLRPDFAVALNNRAWAYYKSGRPEQGMGDVEASLRFDPGSAHSYDTRAHISKALGRKQAALIDFKKALRLADKKLITLYQCGLQNENMYSGKQDGLLSEELFDAMERCVDAPKCDPLPADEECRIGTS